jgi:hypothetical protein
MNEIFQANAQVIQQRWPALWEHLQAQDLASVPAELVEGRESTLSVHGVQLTSRHGRLAEARLQADSIAADAPVVHLYGTAIGDLQGLLLARPALQQLRVYILNSALFALVLGLLDQAWLADPRVELSRAGEHEEMSLPFFALPAEMVLADDFNARMRDRLLSETHLAFNNRHFSAQLPELQQRLRETESLVRSDADVAQLFSTAPNAHVYVIATGPSLEQHLPALKAIAGRAERPMLMCVDTAYRPLREHGITPDLVVSVDMRINEQHLPPEASSLIKLVYMPLSNPAMLEHWQGPRYVGYSTSALYDALRQRLPKAPLFSAGSVLHPAVDLAVKMGARKITLFGADFAFPHGKTHTGWQDGHLGPTIDTARHWLHDGYGRRVKTQLNMRSYLLELERFIARHPEVEFFNTSRDGAMIQGAHYDPEFVQ